MELEFSIGMKSSLPLPCLLNDMTNGNTSRGGFAESRLCFPRGAVCIRGRVALDEWGRNIYRKEPLYRSEIWRLRGTVGIMQKFSYNAAADLYWCPEVGINHWDINSTHPLFGKEKYNRFAFGVGFGVQTEHIFLELAAEVHSMDNKGIEKDALAPVHPTLPMPGHMVKQKVSSNGPSLSLLFGWKF
jgi:hypothetical protein